MLSPLANLAAIPPARWVAGLIVSLTFSALARGLHGVTRSGGVAGAVVCFVLYMTAGWAAVATLVLLFALTWLTTRWGYVQKQRLGTAERGDGRKASQVLANLGIAALCGALHLLRNQPLYLLAMIASLSEAAADTVSGEVGQARNSTARLISTWKVVPPGTNGGVSLSGTLAGVIAAALITTLAALTHVISWRKLAIPVTAATAGMLLDSLLGALLERRGFLNNDAVNFLGTLAAASLAFLFGS